MAKCYEVMRARVRHKVLRALSKQQPQLLILRLNTCINGK